MCQRVALNDSWGLPGVTTILGITAACYRTEKAQILKSAGESAGKSAGKKGTAGGTAGSSRFLWKSRETALLPAVPFFPALFPALLAALFGDLGFLSPVAGGRDSYTICSPSSEGCHPRCAAAQWSPRELSPCPLGLPQCQSQAGWSLHLAPRPPSCHRLAGFDSKGLPKKGIMKTP